MKLEVDGLSEGLIKCSGKTLIGKLHDLVLVIQELGEIPLEYFTHT